MTDKLLKRVLLALRNATRELNAIRARDGAPVGISWGPSGPCQTTLVSEVYFSALVDECHDVLKEAGIKS